MTSRHQDPPTQAPGARPAHRNEPRHAPRTPRPSPPARDEPHLDGLFTYCLSVLCDHDLAIATLGEVLVLAERQRAHRPEDPARHPAWLYALARWSCLRALAEQRAERSPRGRRGAPAGEGEAVPDDVAGTRQRELAQLAWPEAAGTSPGQREALELAVRHRLAPADVAAVLGVTVQTARETLSAAACEVERTRTALAVVETGSCPVVTALTGDERVLLGAALRLELVRHVDSCPDCRRVAEHVVGTGAWPGSTVTPAALPVLTAPRTAAHAAMHRVPRGRATTPRFDRAGFPVDPKDHAARRDRLRARAVTTTVVATVVAAPVLALWAAYRGAPLTGEGRDSATVTASEEDTSRTLTGDHPSYDAYENAGNARPGPRSRSASAPRPPDVSVEVLGGDPAEPSRPGSAAPGRLSVDARQHGDTTVITLRATGTARLDWSLGSNASWLYASRSSGTLAPGETFTVYVSVDRTREPGGHWTAHISVAPGDATIVVRGYGHGTPTSPPPHSHPPTAPSPSDPPPSTPPPSPTPSPSEPDPDPGTPSPDPDPEPTDPSTTPDPTPPAPDPTTQDPTDPPPSATGDSAPAAG